MSAETASTHRQIRLALIARPGIAIRLLDGALQEIVRGIERLEVGVPEGLYLVEWSSAGQQSQTMIRLDGRQAKVDVRFDPSDPTLEGELDARTSDRMALVDAVNGAVRPSESQNESSIVLVETGDVDILRNNSDFDLRLYDRRGVAMEAYGDDAPKWVLGTGERAHCYRVRPGRYHLGFHSILGERLGQSVPALGGRQTLVFLTVAHTKLIVAERGKFGREDSVGVDPARTTIVTVRGDEEDYRVRERVRLAGLMLFDLANATNSLSADVVEVLEDPKTDPLLRLYGALAALSAQERAQSLALSEAPNSGSLMPFDPSWGDRVRRWIGDPCQPGLPTDAIAACWELQRLYPETSFAMERARVPSRVEAPPMLECAWRWAIEESIARPDAVRGSTIVATARSAGGTKPWLCWQLAAATARFVPAAAAVGDLPSLIAQVAEKTSSFVASSNAHPQGLEELNPEIQATALRAMQLVPTRLAEVSTDTVTNLAVALGLPARLLRKRLVNTRAALDSAGASAVSRASEKGTLGTARGAHEQAPGLTEKILHKDDLQKGRFGGKASRKGFVMSADFEKTGSKNWVRIVLLVEGPGQDGETVQFHLHDSFKPSLVTRKFKAGVSRLTVTAWGGFTVGVWIPAHEIELELDLATLKEAPPVVRER